MADDKIIIEFDGDIASLKAKLTRTDKQLSKMQKLSSKFGSSISVAARASAIAFGALATAAVGAINEAKKIESVTTQFEVLTGSVGTATKMVEDLQQFAATTPFQFEGIAKASQQLLGFGFNAEDIVGKMQQIGDVASAIGQPIDDIALIFGQVSAAGKLTGERLLQFQERAVPIGPAIAETLGVAEKSVKDLVSRGEVDFKTFEKAFASLSKKGGFAFEGMIKQSKTLEGLVSTVKDNMSLFAASIGKQMLPVAKLLAEKFLTLIQSLTKGGEAFSSLTTMMKGTLQAAVWIKAAFANLGGVIGITLATAMESAKAAISLNFSQAKAIVVGGGKEVANLLKENNKQLNEELAEIDGAFEATKEDNRKNELKKIATNEKEKLELKRQAKINEKEIIAELEDELGKSKYESEVERLDLINELTNQKLQEQFDAKRAVNQEDIAASIKENQLLLKEEVKYGKSAAKNRAFFRTKEVEGTKIMLDSLITLGRSGSRELVFIAQLASVAKAIMNTAEGVTKALTYGPILGPAMAGAIAAAGAVQIATIKSQKFAKGGLAIGGTIGRDSINATLQHGELVAPRQNFEEVIGSVRAKREAEELGESGIGGQAVEVMISLKDDLGEFIETTVLERRTLGIGAI